MKSTFFYTLVAAAFTTAAIALSATGQSPIANKSIEVDNALVSLIDDVKVPAQEAGRLMKVLVKGGETIEDGALLAEIDNRDTLAKQKIAQGDLDVAMTQAQSTAELDLAKEGVKVADAELQQNQELHNKNPGSITLTELRKLGFQRDRANAQVKVAQDDRQVAQLTTNVKQAQIEATDNELARRQITAPFPGEVNEIFRQVGEWVQPGDPIAHVVRFDKLRVKGMVYAKEAAPVDLIGKPVEIFVTAAGGKEQRVKGKVDFASNVIDGSGDFRTFRIWVEVDNEKVVDPLTKKEAWKIQPGTSARMVIDMTPPAPPKPVKAAPTKGEPAKAAPGGFRPRGTLDAPANPAGDKVESLKPVTGEGAKPRER
jgi:multidrug resistance efflux pump